MTDLVNIHEAKTHFYNLLERVALGEGIIIARAGEPIAKLSPIAPHKARILGGAVGYKLADSFFDDLPEELIRRLK